MVQPHPALRLFQFRTVSNVQFTRVQALSLATHVAFVVILLAPMLPGVAVPSGRAIISGASPIYDMTLPVGIEKILGHAANASHGGGSGGERNPETESRGKLPPFNWLVLTPPQVKTPAQPALAATPAIEGPPDLRVVSPDMATWGNPLSRLVNDSSGPGHGGGIGNNCCGGVGDNGNGRGFGPGVDWGVGDGLPHVGNGYGEPVCVFCPQPPFSYDAVRSKIQGTVVLAVVISAQGRVTEARVAKGIGYGLDEEAMRAVRTWRFKPSAGPDGHASAVVMLIEVNFRLF
jgi:periplasmic protein TonB